MQKGTLWELRKASNAVNASVAFVGGADEGNELTEKKKVIYDEQAGRTRQRVNNLKDELI